MLWCTPAMAVPTCSTWSSGPYPIPGPARSGSPCASPASIRPTGNHARASTGCGREQVPNQDGAGVIDAVGDGVDPSRIGERVWIWEAAWRRSNGTAAEQITRLPSRQTVRLPDDASFDARRKSRHPVPDRASLPDRAERRAGATGARRALRADGAGGRRRGRCRQRGDPAGAVGRRDRGHARSAVPRRRSSRPRPARITWSTTATGDAAEGRSERSAPSGVDDRRGSRAGAQRCNSTARCSGETASLPFTTPTTSTTIRPSRSSKCSRAEHPLAGRARCTRFRRQPRTTRWLRRR